MKNFEIIPAIDIIRGECVRLEQGDYSKKTVYSSDPVEFARKWVSMGAQRLHVVDLEGAKAGELKNLAAISELAQNIHIPIEVGGGIRDLDTVEALLAEGINRVVLGTAAIVDHEFLAEAIALYRSHVVVSIDAREDLATITGWLKTARIDVHTLAKEMEKLGVATLIYTDILKDGMLQGPSFDRLEKLSKRVKIPVIASGGVTSYHDIKRLMKIRNIGGCIIGKALYEGKIDLAQALALLK